MDFNEELKSYNAYIFKNYLNRIGIRKTTTLFACSD